MPSFGQMYGVADYLKSSVIRQKPERKFTLADLEDFVSRNNLTPRGWWNYHLACELGKRSLWVGEKPEVPEVKE